MTAGKTYVPISTANGTGSNSTITFSSIPSTYTDLVLVFNGSTTFTTGDYFNLKINNDTGSNYSNTVMVGNGSGIGSYRNSNQSFYDGQAWGWNTGQTVLTKIHFMNYSNTSNYKTFLTRWDNNTSGTSWAVAANVGLWRSTAAITSISIYSALGNITSTSMATLYGIAAA